MDTSAAYARIVNMQTVAEGVADERTLGLLADLGVDLAQGFFLGRPHSL
jgi:EAL domain-containing protein (putative c-di-GMP-specific phosphodiesterase class I)